MGDKKLLRYVNESDPVRFKGIDRINFYCPGCEEVHSFNSTWTVTNKDACPTVRPSILVNKDRQNPGENICHSFITEGRIQFLTDCTHKLAGQTVDMVAF